MGQPHDLAALVTSAGVGRNGMLIEELLSLMRRNRIEAGLREGMTVADLAAATGARAGGNPAVAMVRRPGSTPPLHYVVVDGVTTRMGQQVVAVRDPQGKQYFELASVFAFTFTGRGITVACSY